jgi:hypothetical protein
MLGRRTEAESAWPDRRYSETAVDRGVASGWIESESPLMRARRIRAA